MDNIKLNRVSIIQRLNKPKKDRGKKLPKTENNKKEKEEQLLVLEEPPEKIKLFERAVGYFNADKDENNRQNPLNKSIETGPPFVCTICQNWFYLGSKLKVHYILNHSYHHCEICSILFINSSDKQRHLSQFHQPIFCEICQKDFQIQDELLQHYEMEHDSTTCVFCGLLVQPKSLLQEHLTKKHQIHDEYLLNLEGPGKFPFIEQSDPPDFFCNLCRKKRSSDVMFGHMFFFHKMSLTSLMNLLGACTGTIKCDGSTKEVIKCESINNTEEYSKYFCGTCGLKYIKKLPEDFHLIYCQGRLSCKFCRKTFTNIINREKHLMKTHQSFVCEQGCTDLSYNSALDLNKHYIKIHENIECNYCDKFINPNDDDKHLIQEHKYKAQLMKNFKDSLFEIVDKNNKHIVVCCLCDENITLLTEQPKNIYLHYEKIHQMSQKKILQLCSSKPILEEYEQLYREINEQLLDSTPINEQEIESDFDADELEFDLDSEFDDSDEQEQYCELCFEDFQTMSELLNHLSQHHKLKIKYNKIECNYCSNVEISLRLYEKHLRIHELLITDPEIIKCDECDILLPKNIIQNHVLNTHEESVDNRQKYGYKCGFCEEKFWDKSGLNQHETSEHKLLNKFMKCYKCEEIFSQKFALKIHCREVHVEGPQFTNFFHKCLQCSVVLPTFELTREHFRRDHPFHKIYKCPVPRCTKTTKRAKYITKHLKSPHNFIKPTEQRSCDICKKEFKTLRAASIHKLMKHQRKMYFGFQCRICQEKFQTMEQRKLHYSTAHPGQLAYSCLECGKGFISKSGLYGHRKIHQQHETLTCPYCNKEFTRRDSYNEHLLIHIGPRHQCPHCPKSFTQRSNLTRHVRIHTGAKPYQCTYCDKRFSDKGACRSHERVHTKEEHCECSYCGKKFTKKQKLKYHIKFHTGEGLVNCEICNKQFSNSYSLNEHRRIHNQQTLVMCNCGRGFTSEKYLQRHITNVHNDTQAKYVCPICFKTLLHKSSYNDHIMTHTSVKHIKCMLCNHEYNTKKTVKRHLFEKHNIDASGTELNKYIYQLKPEDVGLNVPSASEMEINVNDILSDKSLVSIDLSQLQKLETFKNKPKVTNTAKRAKMKEAYIANTNTNTNTLETLNVQSVQSIQIKEEPKSDDEVEESEDDSEDDVILETRKKRKFQKPRKFEKFDQKSEVKAGIEVLDDDDDDDDDDDESS